MEISEHHIIEALHDLAAIPPLCEDKIAIMLGIACDCDEHA